MSKSNSFKKQNSAIEKKPVDDDQSADYFLAYAYQENNMHLENDERLMNKKLLDMFSNFSKGLKQWKTDRHKSIDNRKKSTEYVEMWNIFDVAVSSADDFIEDIDEKIEKLESVPIPHKKNQQLLKEKIEEARSFVVKQSGELDVLEKKKRKLQDGSWASRVFGPRQKNSNTKLKEISTSINTKKQSLKTQTSKFNRKAGDIVERNKTAEVDRIQSMKNRLTDFVKIFGAVSKEFEVASAKCKPKKDVSKWGKTIFRQKSEQSDDSSDEEEEEEEEEENDHIERPSSHQSTKSRLSENGNRDNAIHPTLESVKSLPNGNVKSNKNDLTHRSSVRPPSVVDKKGGNKTDLNHDSFESTAAEFEEGNKDG